MQLDGFWSRSGGWGRRARQHLGVAAWQQQATGSVLSKVSSRHYGMCIWCEHTSCRKHQGKCMIFSTCVGEMHVMGVGRSCMEAPNQVRSMIDCEMIII